MFPRNQTRSGRILPILEGMAHPVSLVILVTALIDLFMTRLLFRTGPDVLSGMDAGSTFFLAVVGRISLTLEQFLIFAFFAAVAYLLLNERDQLLRIAGLTLGAVTILSGVLYAPISAELTWAVSVMLILCTVIVVPLLAYHYVSVHWNLPGAIRLTITLFFGCLILSFIFPLYYRMYFLLAATNIVALPYPLEVYLMGVFAVMATTIAAFAYAVQVPSPGFGMGPRNIVKTMLLPTILVAPVLYAFITSFFALQIFGMVLTLSTDFAISHTVIQALIVVFWFLLTAILLLVFKGRFSSDRMLVQQAIGLVFLLSTTMLFNYPYYLMLGIAGVLLICYPLTGINRNRTVTV